MARSSIIGVNEHQRYVCSIIPPLDYALHKGQYGRIGVVGGSDIYTGAPYFAGMASLRLGADLAYILTTKDAAPAIKSLSPELMVKSVLDEDDSKGRADELLPKLHSLVIGSGMSTDPLTRVAVSHIIREARARDLPIVLDASVIPLICDEPSLIRGYRNAVITPNAHEFKLLHQAIFKTDFIEITPDIVESLARELGNVTILCKGETDIICNGLNTILCDEQGSPRRCGGQGDVLAGLLATFLWWSTKAVRDGTFHSNCPYHPSIVASLGASMVVRRSARNAFKRMHRGTLTSDFLEEINDSFTALFPVD